MSDVTLMPEIIIYHMEWDCIALGLALLVVERKCHDLTSKYSHHLTGDSLRSDLKSTGYFLNLRQSSVKYLTLSCEPTSRGTTSSALVVMFDVMYSYIA